MRGQLPRAVAARLKVHEADDPFGQPDRRVPGWLLLFAPHLHFHWICCDYIEEAGSHFLMLLCEQAGCTLERQSRSSCYEYVPIRFYRDCSHPRHPEYIVHCWAAKDSLVYA